MLSDPFRSPDVKESKTVSWILDFSPWILDSRYSIPDSLPVALGFPTPIVSGIPDPLNCIPDSKVQDSRFHEQKFNGFRNPGSPLHGASSMI